MTTTVWRRFGAPGLALAAAMAVSAPAWAAPAAAPAPAPAAIPAPMPLSESEGLSRHMIGVVLNDVEGLKPVFELGMVMAEGMMRKQAQASKDSFTALAYARFAAWPRMAGDAAWDEFVHDRPAFEEILGRYMAQRFTVEELRAASALVDGPVGKEARAVMIAKQVNHDDTAAFSPTAQAALDRFKASPEGKSFIAKMQGINKDKAFEPVALDLIAEYMPGVMRRWGEKAEAAEEARKAAAAH